MQDYYSLYTWAMDRHAQLAREAEQRRLVRRGQHDNRHASRRGGSPVVDRRDDRRAA